MEKRVIPAVAAVLALLLVKTGAIDALALFVLFGSVPGSQYSVPAPTMLVLLVISIWLIVFRFTAIAAFKSRAVAVTNYLAHKKRLPRRRFKRV